jgi:hypothetical protein
VRKQENRRENKRKQKDTLDLGKIIKISVDKQFLV